MRKTKEALYSEETAQHPYFENYEEYLIDKDSVLNLMQAYADQEVKAATEWIDVKERLPEKSGEVLGIMKYTLDQYICFYRPNRKLFEVYGAGADPISDMQVTHWQPLPHPPIK